MTNYYVGGESTQVCDLEITWHFNRFVQYWLGLGYNSTKCYIFWVKEGYIQSQSYLAMAFCWQTPRLGLFSDAEKTIEPIMSNTMQLCTEILGWKSKMFCELLIQHGMWCCMKYTTLYLIPNMDGSHQCSNMELLWYPNIPLDTGH